VCQELQELVNHELSVIQQTSNALNQCCHGHSAFAGSSEAVECHRLLLVACESSQKLLSLKNYESTQPYDAQLHASNKKIAPYSRSSSFH